MGETGDGQVLEDNSDEIDEDITTYSASVKVPAPRSPFPRGGMDALPTAGSSNTGNPNDNNGDNATAGSKLAPSGGCNLAGDAASRWLPALMVALGLVTRRRNR